MKKNTLLKKISINLLLICSIILVTSCSKKKTETEFVIEYPQLYKVKYTHSFFGKNIEDDYHYLETDSNANINKWISDENRLYDSILNKISFRDSIKKQLEDAVYSSNVRGGFPRLAGKRLFFQRVFVKENTQNILYRDSLSAEDVVLFSTRSLKDKTKNYSIDFFEPSFDGNFLAFGLSSNGDEQTEMYIIDVKSKKILDEKIERATYGNPSWLVNQNSFYYTQLKEVKTEVDYNTMYEDAEVKLHCLGKNPESDKIIFSKKTNPELHLSNIDFPSISTFPSCQTPIVAVQKGSSQYLSIYTINNNNWRKIIDESENTTTYSLYKDSIYTINYKKNPNGTLQIKSISDSRMNGRVLLDSKDYVLEDLIQTANTLYIKKLKNGISSFSTLDLRSKILSKITLPFNGYAYLKSGGVIPNNYIHSDNLYYAIEAWNKEIAVYDYNPITKKSIKTDLRINGKYADLKNIVVKEVEVKSKDGALIPLSIMYNENIKLDGSNPTLLEAYGAYGVSSNSNFYLPNVVWLNMGGIYCVAHVRGGSEKGNDWYKGGFKQTKPNSWRDFISCAEFLIDKKYTNSTKLAAQGSSAGGITVGRAITERPELFKAAILDVSMLNMLNYENSQHTFGVSEFGTNKDSLEYKYLYEMDVYHHIEKGITYPSLLIKAGLNDARVDWWQPAKAVAKLQDYAKQTNNIVLFKIHNSGHSGEPDIVAEESENFSFLLWQLNHPKVKLK